MNRGKVALIGLGATLGLVLVLTLGVGLASARMNADTGGTGTTTTNHCAGTVEEMKEYMDEVHGEGAYDSMMGQGAGGHMGGGTGPGRGSSGMMSW